MVIQDWGYNYLYLRHDGVTTRVNLTTHEYRDVAKLPVADLSQPQRVVMIKAVEVMRVKTTSGSLRLKLCLKMSIKLR